VGTTPMSSPSPAFYAGTGSRMGDLITLLHIPYTLWHLSYIVIGAALATTIDARVLAGTLVAFAFGLGIGAHALDELHDRPLSTHLSSTTLRVLGWGGLAVGGAMAVAASFVISPVALVWGAVAVALAAAYAIERPRWVHTAPGFAIAWGAFPVLVGYWAQTESMTLSVLVVASAAAVFSLAQRALSTPARQVRREAPDTSANVGEEHWDRVRLLDTWERPLLLIAIAHVVLSAGLLLAHASR
jgi:hypothetical protein